MKAKISEQELVDWIAYDKIDPIGQERADLRAASICAVLANINRDTEKRAQPFNVSDFMLRFDQGPVESGGSDQTTEQIIQVLDGFLGKEFR